MFVPRTPLVQLVRPPSEQARKNQKGLQSKEDFKAQLMDNYQANYTWLH